MKLIAVTGNTGQGKTFYVKREFIASNQEKTVIFDINNEYKEFDKANRFFDLDKMIDYLETVKNRIVIVDEATAFFSYRSYNNELNRLLQLRRHRNHFFIFIYHSVDFIPLYLLRYLNYIVIFNQNCNKDNVHGIKFAVPKEKYLFNVLKIM